LNEKGEAAWSKLLVALMEGDHLSDQLAGLDYLKALPYIDQNMIAIAGCSFGGIQTVLAAERDLGLRAAVDFAGAAQTWSRSPDLRERLLAAVRQAAVPIYFIQAQNDYSLTASLALSKEMQRIGKPYEIKIYPPFGARAQDGHAFCVQGGEVWGPGVFSFLEGTLPGITMANDSNGSNITTSAATSVEQLLGSCLAATNVAYGLNNQTKAWLSFQPGAPDFLQTLTEFIPGGGYFINTGGDCTINVGLMSLICPLAGT
jgi:dienelactone hydrolase